MAKTYEIIHEPVTLEGIETSKYNVYYYDEDGGLECKEFHSYDGVSGSVREGYELKIEY